MPVLNVCFDMCSQIVDQTDALKDLFKRNTGATEEEQFWRNAFAALEKTAVTIPKAIRAQCLSELNSVVIRWNELGERGLTRVPPSYMLHTRALCTEEVSPLPPASAPALAPPAPAQVPQPVPLGVPVMYSGAGAPVRPHASSTPQQESCNLSGLSLPHHSFFVENYPSFNVASPGLPPVSTPQKQ